MAVEFISTNYFPVKLTVTDEIVPARVQFTGADGSVMVDSKFKALLKDQFRNYKISFYPGQLDEQIYQVTITTTDGRTLTRPLKLGTGTLKVRGNTDESYRRNFKYGAFRRSAEQRLSSCWYSSRTTRSISSTILVSARIQRVYVCW